MLGAAGQQREERPAGRMGAASAAIEPGTNARAAECVLEQAEIALRRADEHGHLVETHATPRFFQDAPRDLHAFASFTRRREQLERSVRLPHGRLEVRLEQESAQRGQIAGRLLVDALERALHLDDRRGRLAISLRHRGQRRIGAGDQGRDERALRAIVDGHVEQQQRAANGPLAQQRRRSLKELRAIGGGDVGKRRIEARQEIREVGTREVRRAHGLGTEAREPQFLQRARKRTGKSG